MWPFAAKCPGMYQRPAHPGGGGGGGLGPYSRVAAGRTHRQVMAVGSLLNFERHLAGPLVAAHVVVSERWGTCFLHTHPAFLGSEEPTHPRRERRRWGPAGSAFSIVPPAPGTAWGAGRDGGLKRAVPSAPPALQALAPQVFPGAFRGPDPESSVGDKSGTGIQAPPAAHGEARAAPGNACVPASRRTLGTAAPPRPRPGPRLPPPLPRLRRALAGRLHG